MKITKRRIGVLILVMMMLFSQLSFTAFATESEENVTDNNAVVIETIETDLPEVELDQEEDLQKTETEIETENESETETAVQQTEEEPLVMAASEKETPEPKVQARGGARSNDIYFSDRDIESYYGGKNNMYFTPLYILNGNRREVAYCYNGTKAWALAAPGRPGYATEGTHDEQYYLDNGLYFTKRDNPSAQDWADYSDSNADVNAVKRILYNGYPYNASGIQEKYNLDDIAYRAVTQGAIWKVTSGISLKAALGDFTYSGYIWTADMTSAYNELINSELTKEAPADLMMDLYLSENTNYQNLLSTGLTKDEIGTGVLNISKEVTGEAGEMDRAFTFTVEFMDANGNVITDEFNYSGSSEGTIKSGDSITLKSGEYVKIIGIPLNATYKITEKEANSDGYTTTAEGAEGTVTQMGMSAVFVNNRDEVPKTTTVKEEDEPKNETEDKKVEDKSKGNKDSKSTVSKNNSRSPKTGDNSSVSLLTVIMLMSAGSVVVLRRKIRR